MRINGKILFSLFIALQMAICFSMPVTAEETQPLPEDTQKTLEPASEEPKDPEDDPLQSTGFNVLLPQEIDSISSPVLETFLFTGAATSKIPIIVPPGRGNIAPNLTLNYNSYAKNGWLGVGWSMDMGSIQRSTKHGLYYGHEDFVAHTNGSSSELVRWVDWDVGVKEAYRSKIEGSFTKYFYDPSSDSWEVLTKNGITYYYGIQSGNNSKQTNTHGTFKWCLDWVEDPNGNYMEVAYTIDQGQIYLDEINYTGNSDTNAPPTNSVKFHLQDRSDALALFHTHSRVVTAKRLKSIEIKSYNNTMVRAYELTYEESDSTFRSLLTSVTQYGSDAFIRFDFSVDGIPLPPVRFEWLEGENKFGNMDFWVDNPIDELNRPRYGGGDGDSSVLMDMNGDMLPDKVYDRNPSNPFGEFGLYVAINNGYGFYSASNWATYTTEEKQNRPRWGDESGDFSVLMDMNGDGLPDHVHHKKYEKVPPEFGVWVAINYGNGFYEMESWATYPQTEQHWPRWGGQHGDYSVLMDMNGDGLPDHVHYYNFDTEQRGVWVRENNGNGFDPIKLWGDWGSDEYNKPRNSEDDDIYYWDDKVLRDMNGDGLPDHVDYIFTSNPDEGHMRVALNTGIDFGERIEWANFEMNELNYPRYSNINGSQGGDIVVLRDMNGDGLPDNVHLGPPEDSGLRVALNNGTGFEPIEKWDYYGFDYANWPRYSDMEGTGRGDYSALRDINGDGLPDRVFGKNYGSNATGTWVSANRGYGFGPAPPAHLLDQWIDNTDKPQNRPRYSDTSGDKSVLRDMNGDGLLDQVHDHKNNPGDGMWVRLNLGKPDLIESFSNGFGGNTTIEYTASSQYDNHRLPHIVYTVTSITVEDGFSNESETTFDYQGGFYDYTQRDFRGFEYVTQTNPDGTTVTTRFYQEDDDNYLNDDYGYLKGRQRKIEVKEANGAVISRTNFIWYPEFYDSLTGETCAFLKLNRKIAKYYENGSITVKTREDYYYNNVNGSLDQTVVSGLKPIGAEKITTTNEYDQKGTWLWRQTLATVEGSLSGKVRETKYSYENGTGNLLTEKFWQEGVPEYNWPAIERNYDAYGNVETVTDPMGNTTQYDYDDDTHTYPVKVTYPNTGISHIYEVTIDYRYGKVDWQKDENGNETDYYFDEFGRVEQVDYPDEGQIRTFYNDDNSPRSVEVYSKVDAVYDNYAIEYFDGLNRTIQTVSPSEGISDSNNDNNYSVTRIFYDNMGRNHKTVGPFFSFSLNYIAYPPGDCPSSETYLDSRGRPEQIRSYDKSGPDRTFRQLVTEFSYVGLSTTVKDPDGKEKTETKDTLGRIVEMEEDNGEKTQYEYNAAGDMTRLEDAFGNVTVINYDTLGRKKNMIDPAMGFWEYTYDMNGNLKTQTDAKGKTLNFEYDALNRLNFKNYPLGESDVTFSYDNTNAGDNGRGRLFKVSKSNPTIEITYDYYDKMGRERSVSKWIYGIPEKTTYFEYDLSGKLKKIIYPDLYEVDYSYYKETGISTGLIEAVTGSDWETYATFSNYEANGMVGLVEHDNGTSTEYTYDQYSLRLIRLETEPGLQDREYFYSPNGNIEESSLSGVQPSTLGMSSLNYEYKTNPSGKNKHTIDHLTVGHTPYSYHYDSNGNITEDWNFSNPNQPSARRFTYNSDNMPTQISNNGNTVTYVYDGNGIRAKKIGNGITTYYIGKHFEIRGGTNIKYIFAGPIRLAMVKNSNVYYFHKDHQGSTTRATDDNGEVAEKIEYLPFGDVGFHEGSAIAYHLYTDQEIDEEIDLYNYNARLYDPIVGRFMTPDSIVRNPFDPQTLNRFAYVRNNPLMFVDPSGHFLETALISAVIGAAIGGSISAITGGDIETGMLTGAISGALFGAAGAIGNTLEQPVQVGLHALAGGLSGGINSEIYGSDIGLGITTGAISGGVSKGAGFHLFGKGKLFPNNIPSRLAGHSIIGSITGGISAELYGGDFWKGAGYGAWTAAYGMVFNWMAHKVTFEIIEKIAFSRQRTWGAASTSMRCYYRIEKQDYVQELLTFTVDSEDGNKPQVQSIELSGRWTTWYYSDTISRPPAGRIWTDIGPRTYCPEVGPNWMGPIRSLWP